MGTKKVVRLQGCMRQQPKEIVGKEDGVPTTIFVLNVQL